MKKLSEIAQLFDSLHKTPHYVDRGFPMVRVTDIKRGFMELNGTMQVDEPTYEEFTKRYKPQEGDILFSRVGSYGNSCYVNRTEQFCLGQNTVCISPNKEWIDPYYLYCCLNSELINDQIEGVVGGASQPTVSLANINKLSIPCPDLRIQRRIACIISAYDYLIENNIRRIKILEEMAQMIYREWFVNFRFPDHEKVKKVESEIGLIPLGWKASSVGELARDERRNVQPRELDQETPYIGLEHMPRQSIALSEWGVAGKVQSTKLEFRKGEILFGKIRPYFHKVGIAPTDGVCSSDIIVILPKKPEWLSVVMCCVSSKDFVSQATQTSQGTKMPRANWDVLTRYPIPLPEERILTRFNAIILPIIDLIRNLIFSIRNLRQTRDLLLPKLISGEISAENFELETVA